MGVARFALGGASANLNNVIDTIRKDQTISDGERRRRELDIEIAISEAIKSLLQGGASATSAQIQSAIQNRVIGAFQGFVQGGPNAAWPFPRQDPPSRGPVP